MQQAARVARHAREQKPCGDTQIIGNGLIYM